VIEDINKVLLEVRSSPQYRNIIQEWAVPPEKGDEYWKIYESEILNVTE
jgi:hypothetical protein